MIAGRSGAITRAFSGARTGYALTGVLSQDPLRLIRRPFIALAGHVHNVR
jgi:hypothetical protein